MPSFDVISEIKKDELINALDQTKREINTRFDFKNVPIDIKQQDNEIYISAPSSFQLDQLKTILENKLTKRGIDNQSLEYKALTVNLQECRQIIRLKQGIDQDTGKKISKLVKDNKFKVQITIQGNKLRITAKDRDELQAVIQFLGKIDVGLPLQFDNFRD